MGRPFCTYLQAVNSEKEVDVSAFFQFAALYAEVCKARIVELGKICVYAEFSLPLARPHERP